MEYYKQRPCRVCRKKNCPMEGCEVWRDWFSESWGAVNAYAWRCMDELGRREPTHFCYDQPHMIKSPCHGCRCAAWCHTPCSLRLRWWDQRMAAVRRRLGKGL